MASSTASRPATLRETFEGVPFESHASKWDTLYREDHYPWDRNGPSIALADLLTERPDLVPPAQECDHRGNLIRDEAGAVARLTALVPGCGRGHDVLLLSSFGYDTLGLDSSSDALRLAGENHKTAEAAGRHEPVAGVELGSIGWASGDFFSDDWSTGKGSEKSGKFDLIFDYTFLCALPPDVRPSWARRMSELLSPGGRLVCLEFPSGKPPEDQGPPWGITPEVYESLLTAPGEDIPYDSMGNVIEKPSSKPHRDALHRLSLIKPQRTHAAGTNEDGSISDFISVWSR